MGVSVGIDLGTTYSAVAWINPTTQKPEIVLNSYGMPTTPSVIRFDGPDNWECGQDAKESFDLGEPNCVCAFKRSMGTDEICINVNGRAYNAEDLSSILLAHLKCEAEERLKDKITGAVITVPAYFFNEERAATIRAAEKAGLPVLRIINEPTAAALNYSVKSWRENAVIMVYDLGGGTFDCTLIGMGPRHTLDSIGTNGDHRLGGKDWDAALSSLVLDKIESEKGIKAHEDKELVTLSLAYAEGWKRKLSTTSAPITCRIQTKTYGRLEVSITAAEFEKATEPLLEHTLTLCENVLHDAKLNWRNITDILLVGGSTRMPQVAKRLTKLLGKAPIAHVHPDEAVAIGAAIQTAMEEEEKYEVYNIVASKEAEKKAGLLGRKPASPQNTVNDMWRMSYVRPVKQAQEIGDFHILAKRDVQAHGMGIITVNPEGNAYINETIIPPNVRVPVKCAKAFRFYTDEYEENKLEIYVVEGEDEPAKAAIKGKYVVTGIRHLSKGETRIRVQYSFDKNSIIHVQARQENDTKDLPIHKEPISPEEIKRFGEKIDPNTQSFHQKGQDITLVVDVSGSMSGTPLRDAMDAMVSFVDKFERTHSRIGVMVVSDKAQWILRPTDKLGEVKNAIHRITVAITGYGNSAHPFDDIFNYYANVRGNRCAIVLADGQWSNENNAIMAAKRCHKAGIDIAAIGFGTANRQFLEAISSRKDLSILTDQSRLTQSFGTIAQSFGSQRAFSFQKRESAQTETWETID